MTTTTQQITTKIIRQSNIEALRIVAMSMVLIHHFLLLSLTPPIIGGLFNYINPAIYAGVDIFFIITGFFQIRLQLKSFLRITGLFILFQFSSFTLLAISGQCTSDSLMSLFTFPFSQSPYWFMQVYLGIMILSPLLNIGINAMTRRELRYFALIVTTFTFYSCWYGGNMANYDGYSLMQGIYLYIIGSLISREKVLLMRKPALWYFIAALISLLLAEFIQFTPLNSRAYFYNSPFMVGVSVFLLCAFMQLDFKSKFINALGGASLGAYLLQDGLFGKFFYPWQHEFAISDHPLYAKILMFVFSFIGFWIASYILTTIYNFFFARYAEKSISFIKNMGRIVRQTA